MKNTFAKKFTVCTLAGVLGFALTACDDSSSAGGDNGSGGNRGGIPDTVETFMELSDYDCGRSQKCVATYLTEYHDMAVCDGDNGWVIGTLIEKMDCDFSSSSDKSSDSKGNPSSAGTSTKSSNSNSSGNGAKSSNSSVGKEDCSALLEGNTGWSWDVPKECRFNPDIDYGSMTDERDGNVYRTVKIGDQVWMAENLNYDPGQGGLGEDKYDWSWCYNNEPKNCDVAGRLYTWAAAIDSVKLANDIEKPCVCGFYKECHNIEPVQGICPKGWHLPSRSEWDTLFKTVHGWSTAAAKLKAQSGWNGKGNGDDSFGFTAIPSGIRTFSQRFDHVGHYAYFWSSTDYYGSSAYGIYLIDYDRSRYEKQLSKDGGYSVRCVKDSE